MGAITGLVGLNGGASGTGFQTPQQAQIQQGVNTGQTTQSYGQNQQALAQQQGLLNALQGQNGIGNQSSVYNQMQGIANGTGPNPAQAMLAQQTGQNVATQGALMAGQRGASGNVGLMARQAAQQGAATQQQAVGQGDTMQANQSLNALGQMGNIANTQASNQIGATGAVTQANQAEQGNLLNALGAQNSATVGSQGSVNSGNTTLAGTQMQGQQGLLGGAMNAAGSIAGLARGGQVGASMPMASGGMAGPQSSFGQFLSSVGTPGQASSGPAAQLGSNAGAQALSQVGSNFQGPQGSGAGEIDNYNPDTAYAGPSAGPWAPGMNGPAQAPDTSTSTGVSAIDDTMSGGGMVDVVLSPGEKVVSPGKVSDAAGGLIKAMTVPGKANVKGDSLKNDTYKTKLPEGSVVIPRTKSKDPQKEKSFVQATLAKRGRK